MFRISYKYDNGSCEKFMVRKNPKRFQNNLRLVNCLFNCKNYVNIWNIDCNETK